MFASLVSARCILDETAREFDASSLSQEAASRVVDELGAVRRAVDGMLAKAARRVAETQSGERDAAASVARTLGVATGEVRAAIDTATRLVDLPATDLAVREGRSSARETQMIAEAATINPAAEERLLEVARQGMVPLKDACIAARAEVEDPAARAARHHAQRHLRIWIETDGMVSGRFRFAPEVGGPVKAAIDAAVQRTFRARRAGTAHEPHETYAADALAEFVLTDARGTMARRSGATVHVLIDHGALMRGGAVGGEVCEIPGVGPVDVTWVRELLGSAFVTAVVKRGKDILTVAHLGRHVPAEVQTALLVSGRECDIAGCNHRGYLERDHTHDYAKGGRTAFWNLRWLCYRHHRLKSAGWRLGAPDSATRKRTLRPPPARAA